MARLLHAAPLALATILAACGSGGGEGVGFNPPPPLSPTPSPTPTPVSVAPFRNGSTPTFYSTNHVAAAARVGVEPVAGGKSRVISLDQLRHLGGAGIGNFEYRGSNSYAVEFAGFGGPVFLPADQAPSSGPFDSFRTTSGAGHYANLELARPGAGIALTYATFGNVIESFGSSTDAEVVFFAVGSPTPRAQAPTTGSATFTGIADGLWVDGATTRRLYGSSATLTADFAAGQVTSRLDLRGHGDPFGAFQAAPTTTLGTFSGTGTIASSGFYSGGYAPAGGYSGSFQGTFYGPAAEEFGLGFQLTGSPGQSAIGVAVGKKQ
jgi:hypothetical protein